MRTCTVDACDTNSPYGQRAEDLVAWAHEILARYSPSIDVAG